MTESAELTRRLIEMQDNQSAVLSALTEVLNRLADKQTIAPSDTSAIDEFEEILKRKMSELERVGTGNSQSSQANITVELGNKVTVSPKLDFAIEYLRLNPDDRKKSGRELEASILMSGETISYKWWNKAKQTIAPSDTSAIE